MIKAKAHFRSVALALSAALLIWAPAAFALDETARLLYAEGLQLLQQGHYQQASQRFERAIRIQPRAELSFALGVAYFRLHQPVQAYQAYLQALSLLPDPGLSARIRSGLGDVFFDTEDYAQAIAAYRSALDHQPTWTGVRLKLATSYLRLGRYSEALRESENLLAEQTPLSEARYLRSLIYVARQQWPAAIEELEQLAREPAHRFEAWRQLNWIYRMQQRYDRATELAQEVLAEFGPSIPQAYQLAAATLLEKLTLCLPEPQCQSPQEKRQLHEYLERWVLMTPDQPQSHFELGWLAQLEGDWPAARDAYERAHRLFPSRPDYLLKLAEMEWALGRQPDARIRLEQLAPLMPDSPLWRELPRWSAHHPSLFARWTGADGFPTQIQPFWLSYLNGLKRNASALSDAAKLSAPDQTLQALRLWQAGQPAWARALLLQARRQESQWWLPSELLGRLQLETGASDALLWLEAAYRLNPISRDLALLLAEHLPPGAQRREHLKRALQTFADDPRLQELYLQDLSTR